MSQETAEKPVKLDANQLARQRKKIEKDRRRKQYDDLQVQGTNNSSIVSKRSVEMLYTNKLNPEMGEWFKFFVPKPKRRSPAINRGYWIRMESIRQMVLRICAKNKGKTVHVVNLGCGFDPLPFQLLSNFKGQDVKLNFLDFDYPELVQNKLKMIQDAEEIRTLIGYEVEQTKQQDSAKSLGIVLSTDNYKLVGCDLKNEDLYQKQLDYLLDDDSVKIFIAEVSLAYMKPEFANPIIKHSGNVKNSHFVILEQILPDTKYNAFAQKMMYHFDHLRSPLQCVESYPLASDQINRFKQYYPHVELRDLFGNWIELVDEATRSKVAAIETFDEWEEFIIFCQHYVIVHSTNMENQEIYETTVKEQPKLELDASVKFELESSPQIQLKFPAVESFQNKTYIHGGLDQTRTDKTLVYENGKTSELETSGTPPSARMCHSMTAVDDSLIVVGGRSRPGLFHNDVYRLQNNIWTRLADLPVPRSRHAAVRVGNEVLIFGGLQSEDAANDLFVMVSDKEIRALKVVGTIPNLASCMMTYNGEFGVIVGGMYDADHPWVSSSVYRFAVQGDTVVVEEVFKDIALERIGCRGVLAANNKLVVIGGISPRGILHRNSQVITVELPSTSKSEKSEKPVGKIRGVEIPVTLYETHPPILIGFGVSEPNKNHITVVGGGGVCYSFGSTYNSVYRISYE